VNRSVNMPVRSGIARFADGLDAGFIGPLLGVAL
jgi:hypothetical protein